MVHRKGEDRVLHSTTGRLLIVILVDVFVVDDRSLIPVSLLCSKKSIQTKLKETNSFEETFLLQPLSVFRLLLVVRFLLPFRSTNR